MQILCKHERTLASGQVLARKTLLYLRARARFLAGYLASLIKSEPGKMRRVITPREARVRFPETDSKPRDRYRYRLVDTGCHAIIDLQKAGWQPVPADRERNSSSPLPASHLDEIR